MTILLTGAAGFIGYHAAQRLLGQGRRVVGVDNLNSYYDPKLKRARLARLTAHPRFQFEETDLADRGGAEAVFARGPFDLVLHLAAQAGEGGRVGMQQLGAEDAQPAALGGAQTAEHRQQGGLA